MELWEITPIKKILMWIDQDNRPHKYNNIQDYNNLAMQLWSLFDALDFVIIFTTRIIDWVIEVSQTGGDINL